MFARLMKKSVTVFLFTIIDNSHFERLSFTISLLSVPCLKYGLMIHKYKMYF